MPEFDDAFGVAIVYDVYPADDPRGVVQILHGVGEHAGRYVALAQALAAAGYIVYADDHRGHGRTGIRQHGTPEKLGRLGRGGHPAALDAVWRMTELIRGEHPELPLILLGHSWGSFLAQMLLDRHPDAYDAVVLTGSALRWPGSMNVGDLNAPWKHTVDGSGMEWLASDEQVGRDFVDDPLTTTVPIAKLFGIVDGLRLFGRPRRDLAHDVPVLLMVGRDDSVGGPRSVHRLADAYRNRSGLTDVTTLVYPGVRHEVFHDVSQDEVRADLRAWLDARFPARD